MVVVVVFVVVLVGVVVKVVGVDTREQYKTRDKVRSTLCNQKRKLSTPLTPNRSKKRGPMVLHLGKTDGGTGMRIEEET